MKPIHARLGSIVATVALVAVAGGCGTAAKSLSSEGTAKAGNFAPVPRSDQVSITFESQLPEKGAVAAKLQSSLISSFEAAHPNIHVTTQTPISTVSNAALSVQVEEASGQNVPDLVQEGLDSTDYFVNDLHAIDLTKTFGTTAVANVMSGKYPYAGAVKTIGDLGGDTYGIGWTISTPIIFYNANLFTKADLNPGAPPTTWSGWQSALSIIKQATGADGMSVDCFGVAQSVSDWCLQGILRSAAGNVLSRNGQSVTFDNAGNVTALSTLQGLANAGLLPNLTTAQNLSEFLSGQLVAIMGSTAQQGSLLTGSSGHFKLMVAPMPKFGTLMTAPTESGSGLFILKSTPLQERASFELLQWLTSPSSEAAISRQVGYAILRPSMVNSPLLSSWKYTQPFLNSELDQLLRLSPLEDYPGPNFAQIEALLVTAATKAIYQKANPTSQLAAAQAQARSLS